MNYKKVFKPENYRVDMDGESGLEKQDIRDGSIYVYDEPLIFAVNVAIQTGRPLLVLGPPGSGKSSLAAFVARSLGWNYYEKVITSGTSAQDLLWKFDAVRRLGDAMAQKPLDVLGAYIEPECLWWAFDIESAMRRGIQAEVTTNFPEPIQPGTVRNHEYPSVVLLDEIDKADPDMPNDLLVTLGSRQFKVSELNLLVKETQDSLIIITSNEVRALPAAFTRRCIVHRLAAPDNEKLIQIAISHFPDKEKDYRPLFEKIAGLVVTLRGVGESYTPSTAEYLDAVRSCIELNVEPSDSFEWNIINSGVLFKQL